MSNLGKILEIYNSYHGNKIHWQPQLIKKFNNILKHWTLLSSKNHTR